MVFVACIRSRFGICRVTPRIPRIVLSDISDNTGILSENSRILLSDAAAVLSDIRSDYIGILSDLIMQEILSEFRHYNLRMSDFRQEIICRMPDKNLVPDPDRFTLL